MWAYHKVSNTKVVQGNVQISYRISLFINANKNIEHKTDLAQLVERKSLNLVVMGMSPMVSVN